MLETRRAISNAAAIAAVPGIDPLLRRYVGMGVQQVLGGGDLGFMTAAATEPAKMLRDCC